MRAVNPHKGRTGLERIGYALAHSAEGLRAAFMGESAFRQEVLLAFVLAPLALWVAGDWRELALLIGSLLLVLIVELLNSGIEAAIDRISYEQHELSKRAKDMGSAAVLIALVLCGLVWCLALWARFS
ncbi:MAG: diacylglycerol kinase [Pigmentiphaga sp.]|jgi:Diacylglycerol kinase|uniref:diacylglycerol kinase n=1 Tax=Pigmentiphaga sp. TaxID=1977564 RepID=UPI0025D76C14|nr:diacylglycerol kinase [Pigmentiphaga sp.]MBX6317843.1 diacylglycerol kinase [Pigmentiphaga sp.]MDX3904665.1 diacylglycerol kinase [Pigmentiphaga sp.]